MTRRCDVHCTNLVSVNGRLNDNTTQEVKYTGSISQHVTMSSYPRETMKLPMFHRCYMHGTSKRISSSQAKTHWYSRNNIPVITGSDVSNGNSSIGIKHDISLSNNLCQENRLSISNLSGGMYARIAHSHTCLSQKTCNRLQNSTKHTNGTEHWDGRNYNSSHFIDSKSGKTGTPVWSKSEWVRNCNILPRSCSVAITWVKIKHLSAILFKQSN